MRIYGGKKTKHDLNKGYAMEHSRSDSTTARQKFLPRGAATSPVKYDGPPKTFYFALLPKLTMLALASAIEPLRVANQIARCELYNWFTMTVDGQPIQCSNGMQLIPDHKLDVVPRDADVFVCAGIEPASTIDRAVTSWVRYQRRLGSQVGSICTGGFTLAEAGLLEDKRFTLHWENHPSFLELFPDLLPTINLFEIDGPVMTAAGGSAAADMMLHLIEQKHGGAFATMVADMCLHGRSHVDATPQRTSWSAVLNSRNPTLIEAVQLMHENLEEPLRLEAIAAHVQISRRQLERSFKTHLGIAPRGYYTDLRLGRAYALFCETNMSVSAVAAASGFNSSANLSKLFRAKFGVTPMHFRRSWAVAEPSTTPLVGNGRILK